MSDLPPVVESRAVSGVSETSAIYTVLNENYTVNTTDHTRFFLIGEGVENITFPEVQKGVRVTFYNSNESQIAITGTFSEEIESILPLTKFEAVYIGIWLIL
jgi:hypothetical protein